MAKADLVPTAYNLLDAYPSFAALETACAALTEELNGRPHALTRRVPLAMLEVERTHLHAIPDTPFAAAFGESRTVGWSATVSFRAARYSVPDRLCDTQVWVRTSGGEVIIVSGEGSGATEVARHRLVGPGQTSLCDEHYTHAPSEHLPTRTPRPRSRAERDFVALGEGAVLYLSEAAATGAGRIECRMAQAVALAALHGRERVDAALQVAAMVGRFADGDLESILVHAKAARSCPAGPPAEHSLAAGTAMWSALGGIDEDRDEGEGAKR